MAKKKKIRVGSKLVEMGKVYRVFKIETKKIDDEIKRIIHFKPYFKDPNDSSLVCSIPEDQIGITNIRHPISKDELKDILKQLSRKVRIIQPTDNNEAKQALKSNDIMEATKVARRYWKEKKKKKEDFTKNKRDILDSAIDKIVQEAAIVYNVSIKTAEKKIRYALQRK